MTRSASQRFLPPHLRLNTLAISVALASTFASPLSIAQTKEGFALEEVIVTARKTEESLQDVPVAVSAFNGEALKSLGINSVKDMEGIVPGLNMGGGGNGTKGDSNPYIRGIGQRETKVTVDSAVGTYIDGIYSSRSPGALLDAADVESMQVLRGPQGTLFGKNTTGGAIVINTVKPQPDFGGHLDLTVGNFGRKNASGTINVPLIEDTLSSRFTLAQTRSDGYVKNVIDGRTWNEDDRQMAMGQFRWDATDLLQVDLLLAATKTRQKSRGQQCNFYGQELFDTAGIVTGELEREFNKYSSRTTQEYCEGAGKDLKNNEFKSELNGQNTIFRQSIYEVDTKMAGLTFNLEFDAPPLVDELSFKSITGFRQVEQKADEDLDGSNAALLARIQPVANQTNQYTQEFQFTGNAMDGRLRGTLGLFASLEETDNDWLQTYVAYGNDSTLRDDLGGNIMLAQSDLTERETKNTSWAVFSQVSYDITDLTEVTFGLRYTAEERETTYHEANIWIPSLGVGDCTACVDNINPLNPIGVIHGTWSGGAAPMDQWIYGYDTDGDGNLNLGAFGEASESRKDTDWSPSLSLKVRASDDLLDRLALDEAMTFITLSQGFRSGGVVVGNTVNEATAMKDMAQFEPEYVNNIEVGVKFDALEGALRGNMALYYTDYSDIQVTTVKPGIYSTPLPAIENAGKAIIQGLEGEFTFIPHESVRLTASFAYTDADYKEYDVDTLVNGVPTLIDRSNEPMPRVAKYTGFLAADYFLFTESYGTFTPTIIARYTSGIYHGFDLESFLVEDQLTSSAETFIDARLTWQLPDDQTTVTLWGKNLTNVDDYLVGGIPLVGVTRSSGSVYAEPRTFGINFSYNFD